MKRLTYKKEASRRSTGQHPTDYTSRCTFQEVVARLAAYEDTGMEPEHIIGIYRAYIELISRTYGPLHQKIVMWLQAERDGRLVVLPCKVGDRVYFIRWRDGTDCNPPIQRSVYYFSIEKDGVFAHFYDGYASIEQFGKPIFLTREEAKAALAEKGEENA